MKMPDKRRVVIVGAGPGGAAAAVRLAQRGAREVLLLDKDRFPREKTCGSALSPNGVKLVGELGIGAEVERLGYWIDGLILTTPGGQRMELRTPRAAVVLLRKHFDNLLVEKARDEGVEFRGGFKVTQLVREGGRVVGVRGRPEGEAVGELQEIRADYVLCADGAHSIFSDDPRSKRTISTLMGWWEGFDFEPHMMEMAFDRNLAPLYGWMFPENAERVNIGICIDGELPDGSKQSRNVREVFQQFLDDHYATRLRAAKQIGKFKGHPISYTTWITHCDGPGVLWLGEAARITHNATGEGIYQAMQSGVYAADALADVLGGADEAARWQAYRWQVRRRFTFSFVVGHALRAALRTPVLDGVASLYNDGRVRRAATWAIGWAMAGSRVESGEAAAEAPLSTVRSAVG